MYEDTALHINKMKKKEDIAMQTGNPLDERTPNCRFRPDYDIITDVIITVMKS